MSPRHGLSASFLALPKVSMSRATEPASRILAAMSGNPVGWASGDVGMLGDVFPIAV